MDTRFHTHKPIKGSVCYRIFNDGFPCYTPKLFTMNKNLAERFGVRSAGNRLVDEAMLGQIVRVTIPISDMIQIRQDGGNVEIIERRHRIEVRDLITKHLTNWVRVAEVMDVKDLVPQDDLFFMNEFLDELTDRHNQDMLEEDKAAFNERHRWQDEMHEAYSFFRAPRPMRPTRDTLGGETPIDIDISDEELSMDASLTFDRDVDIVEEDPAFKRFRRKGAERSLAYEALQELINLRT